VASYVTEERTLIVEVFSTIRQCREIAKKLPGACNVLAISSRNYVMNSIKKILDNLQKHAACWDLREQ
jgi:hypothetical protein